MSKRFTLSMTDSTSTQALSRLANVLQDAVTSIVREAEQGHQNDLQNLQGTIAEIRRIESEFHQQEQNEHQSWHDVVHKTKSDLISYVDNQLSPYRELLKKAERLSMNSSKALDKSTGLEEALRETQDKINKLENVLTQRLQTTSNEERSRQDILSRLDNFERLQSNVHQQLQQTNELLNNHITDYNGVKGVLSALPHSVDDKIHQLESLIPTFQDLQRQIDTFQTSRDAESSSVQSQVQELGGQLGTLRQRFDDIQQRNNEFQSTYQRLVRDTQASLEKASVVEQQLSLYKGNISTLQEMLQQRDLTISQLQNEILTLQRITQDLQSTQSHYNLSTRRSGRR